MFTSMQQVIRSPSDSWFRNNQLANILWDLDEYFVKMLGVEGLFPVWFRVIYMAFNTSFGILLTLAFINRLMMRILCENDLPAGTVEAAMFA